MSARRPAPSPVHCTERDLRLLAWVSARGCAGDEQLARLFWRNRRLQTARERLAKLVAAHYLHSETVDARGHSECMYWVERKGARTLRQADLPVLQQGKPARAEVAHLLKTGDVLIKLGERGKLLTVMHEHALKAAKSKGTGSAQVADAYVELERDGTTEHFFLEIDGAYYGVRLKNKVIELGQSAYPVRWVVYSRRRFYRIDQLSREYTGGKIKPLLFDAL